MSFNLKKKQRSLALFLSELWSFKNWEEEKVEEEQEEEDPHTHTHTHTNIHTHTHTHISRQHRSVCRIYIHQPYQY